MGVYVFCLFLVLINTARTLDNGLALTPPMGWLTWQRFRCNTDCVNDPYNCLSEKLIKIMADRMVSMGFRDVGYKYIMMDDCWLDKTRDEHGRLRPDPKRFPSGIKKLVEYVHARGLLFGIYEDFGHKTCAGYPGSEFHMETDAKTFAEWEVDYVKFDGCNSDPKDAPYGYPAMAQYLNQTGRPMVYSCEWPLYFVVKNLTVDYGAVRKACNLWRNFNDVTDAWDSVKSILDYYAKDDGNFSQFAGPGGWNDPDMLVVGDFGLSEEGQKLQFGMYAMMASPLIMSNDLRKLNNVSKALLQNRRVIAINQDPLGRQGTLVKKIQKVIEIWKKELTPLGSYAIALNNKDDVGVPIRAFFKLRDLGLMSPSGYNVTEVFDGTYIGKFMPDTVLKVYVNPNGIALLKAVPLHSKFS